MDILIMGIGGLGGVFAAELIRNGYTPTLITENQKIADAINANGLTLSTPDEDGVVVPATATVSVADLSEGMRFDAVWLVMKVQGVLDAVRESLPLLKPDGYMVCFQNGLIEDDIIEILGDAKKLISASVAFGGTMEASGVYRRTTDGKIFVGELDGSITERVKTLQSQLAHILTTDVTDNIVGFLWSKLCWNASVSGLGAILGMTFGEIVELEHGRDLLIRGYREVMDTARANGITLVSHVVGPVTELYLKEQATEAERMEKHAILKKMTGTFAAVRPSSLQSLERGRPTETYYLNGYVIRKAHTVGMRVPLNEIIADMIGEIEAGERDISPDNLHELLSRLNA